MVDEREVFLKKDLNLKIIDGVIKWDPVKGCSTIGNMPFRDLVEQFLYFTNAEGKQAFVIVDLKNKFMTIQIKG